MVNPPQAGRCSLHVLRTWDRAGIDASVSWLITSVTEPGRGLPLIAALDVVMISTSSSIDAARAWASISSSEARSTGDAAEPLPAAPAGARRPPWVCGVVAAAAAGGGGRRVGAAAAAAWPRCPPDSSPWHDRQPHERWRASVVACPRCGFVPARLALTDSAAAAWAPWAAGLGIGCCSRNAVTVTDTAARAAHQWVVGG